MSPVQFSCRGYMSGLLCLDVDCRFLRWHCMCPLEVAVERGRCFLMLCAVTLGHVTNCLFLAAAIHVECKGLKAAP
eukprot:9884359-Ditylum_brightwellii.AAC.1